MDVATLGLTVTSGSVVEATRNLDGMTAAAGRTERAAGQLGRATQTGMRLAGHEVLNLQRQISDVGVSLASGQSPFSVLIQQGAQIQDIFGARGLRSVIGGLAQGIMSLVNPTTLALAAITAVGYAATAAFEGISGSVKSADDALKDHDEWIKRVKNSYAEAVTEASKLRESREVLEAGGNRNIETGLATLRSEMRAAAARYSLFTDSGGGELQRLMPESQAFIDVLRQLQVQAQQTRPDVTSIREEIARLRNEAGRTDAEKAFADALMDILKPAQDVANTLPVTEDVMRNLGAAAEGEAARVSVFARALRELNDIAKVRMSPEDLAAAAYRDALSNATTPGARASAEASYLEALERIRTARLPIPHLRGVDDVPEPTERGGGIDPWANLREEKFDREAMRQQIEALREADRAIEENRRIFGGFLSDLKNGIKDGESFWDSFANAADRAMDRILDRMLDDFVYQLFPTSRDPGGSVGPWGWLGKLLGGGGGPSSSPASAPAFAANTTLSALLGAGNDNSIARAPVASASVQPITDWLSYANGGAIRDMKLSPKLEQALSFLSDMGIRGEVFSGGQPAFGPNRTGSHRHDLGNAADMMFYKGDRRLDWANPEDLPIFEEIVRRGRGAGLTGFGAGPGYMRKGSMHVGFGSEATWGAGGDGDNAPAWLQNAFERPLTKGAERLVRSFDQVSTASVDTAGSLTDGLGKVADSLASGAGEGGGGFFDLIAKLFGGIFGGKGFAEGTEFAPAGWAWVGERGPELMKLRGGETIRSNGHSQAMAAAYRNGQPTNINVQFHNNNQPIERVEEEDDGFGGRRMNVVFGEQWSKDANTRGNPISNTLRSMGVRQRAPLR